jgi:hypothetical protein
MVGFCNKGYECLGSVNAGNFLTISALPTKFSSETLHRGITTTTTTT